MQNKEYKLIFQKKDMVLGKPVLRTSIVTYKDGKVILSGYGDIDVGYHEAYPPQTISCAREIFEDLGFKEVDPLENLRAFIRTGPFQIRKIEEALSLSRGVVSHFLNTTYTDKQGNVLKNGLGPHEEKVLEYMKTFGYKEDIAYEQFL